MAYADFKKLEQDKITIQGEKSAWAYAVISAVMGVLTTILKPIATKIDALLTQVVTSAN